MGAKKDAEQEREHWDRGGGEGFQEGELMRSAEGEGRGKGASNKKCEHTEDKKGRQT